VGSPSGVIHFEATIRQHLTRSRFPGVILFEATRVEDPVYLGASQTLNNLADYKIDFSGLE
jgi:hypothetical protein